ncbi:hypothetical protein K431DRAFT_142257 [Polychaeton citri CBS 116435]|uniref:Uncharacterized protein n=1 Tax=Polychaeton citri CBS 116435 TaxID=1314669 RepID=A0A9P4Q4W3_9PEZI|nr:hypothetical protein K431DRAFT_142257 [Polychaeton citri CBS 116435]
MTITTDLYRYRTSTRHVVVGLHESSCRRRRRREMQCAVCNECSAYCARDRPRFAADHAGPAGTSSAEACEALGAFGGLHEQNRTPPAACCQSETRVRLVNLPRESSHSAVRCRCPTHLTIVVSFSPPLAYHQSRYRNSLSLSFRLASSSRLHRCACTVSADVLADAVLSWHSSAPSYLPLQSRCKPGHTATPEGCGKSAHA